MYREWILRLLTEKAGNRKVALKGSKGQDQELEQLIVQEFGQPDIEYFTAVKDKVNNRDTFSFSEFGGRKGEYYLIIPSVEKYNEAERKTLEGWGYREFDDFLWLNHDPIDAMDVAEGAVFPRGGYNNKAVIHSDGVKIRFLGICSQVEIGYGVKWPRDLVMNLGSNVQVRIGNGVSLGNSKIIVAKGGCIDIADKCILSGMRIFVNCDSELRIGRSCTLQDGRIRTGRNSGIAIGEDCMFSWAITLLAHDRHMIYDVASGKCMNNTAGERRESIVIGDHVWIGGETAVLPNTRIGSGSICGYRSLVKGSYPNNCILAGSPARVVKRDVAWARDNIDGELSMYRKLPEEYRRLSGL